MVGYCITKDKGRGVGSHKEVAGVNVVGGKMANEGREKERGVV